MPRTGMCRYRQYADLNLGALVIRHSTAEPNQPDVARIMSKASLQRIAAEPHPFGEPEHACQETPDAAIAQAACPQRYRYDRYKRLRQPARLHDATSAANAVVLG